jgi:hypothetical protein
MQETLDISPATCFCRTTVHHPPYLHDSLGLWFAHAEAQFNLAAISDERAKFNYVILQLENRHAAEVEDLMTSPPADEQYTIPYTARRLSSSREKRVGHLLTHEEFGDRKLPQFLCHLKNFAPDVPDDFLRSIWSSSLPPHIQAIMAVDAECNLDAAAQLIARTKDFSTLPTTAAIPQGPDIASLLEKIEEISRRVAALSSGHTRYRSHSRHKRRARNIFPSAHGPDDPGYCRYHRQFGDKAQRCSPPCFFHKQGNGKDRR